MLELMRARRGLVDTTSVKSFTSILSNLSELETTLPKSNLAHFLVFNQAYFVVTSHIQQASRAGYFDNQAFVETFTAHFARRYFQAMNNMVRNNSAAPAWAIANGTSQLKNTPLFVVLLMGANAHINHDLPLTLLELLQRQKTESLIKDVFKIDKLLMKSGKEILTKFDEPNRRLDFLKRHFVWVYYRPAMYLILWWRIKAWRSYRSLKKTGVEQSQYAKSSVKIAKRFVKLARLLA